MAVLTMTGSCGTVSLLYDVSPKDLGSLLILCVYAVSIFVFSFGGMAAPQWYALPV